jgi:hypothetical protein
MVGTLLRRARAKGGRALVRTVMLRVWPFSWLTLAYYRARFTPLMWNRVLNRSCRTAWSRHSVALTGVQQRAVRDLQARGISVMRIEELLAEPAATDRLRQDADRLLGRPDVARQIVEHRSQFGGKDYVIRAFGGDVAVDLSNELLKLALDERVIAVANTYLGMCSRLKYVDLWYNVPGDPAAREIASQRWHRDYDDYRMVKLFLYLVDVDDRNGPFTYMPETHAGGRWGALFPSTPPSGSVPEDGALEAAVGAGTSLVCTGSAGTLVLADTAGFHKGGRAVGRPRILFTATYASDASVETDRYRLAPSVDRTALGPLARFAIRA